MSIAGAEQAKIHHQDETVVATEQPKNEEEKKKEDLKSRLLKTKD
jgi:hypothetical protein